MPTEVSPQHCETVSGTYDHTFVYVCQILTKIIVPPPGLIELKHENCCIQRKQSNTDLALQISLIFKLKHVLFTGMIKSLAPKLQHLRL